MCTYQTSTIGVAGSGKGPSSWKRLGTATVYLDHPVHALAAHTLNIDLTGPGFSPGERVALELEPMAAMELARSILDAIASTPATITGIKQNGEPNDRPGTSAIQNSTSASDTAQKN